MESFTISADPEITTVISTFNVAADHQQELLDLLTRNAAWLRAVPGFIASAVHPSDDGSKIVNYAQWRNPDALNSLLKNPAMSEHREQVAALATVEAVRFSVGSVHLAARND